MAAPQTDTDLVRRTLAGQAEAYGVLARRWAPRVAALCHAKVRRAEAADDLAQEAFLRGFRAIASLQDPARFGAWLLGIARRTCLDWLKRKERGQVTFGVLAGGRDPEEVLAEGGRADTDPEVERRDETARLLAEVERLPEKLREVVMLYYYEDVTYKQLAEALGVSAATVNARLTKARGLLRARLSGSQRPG